MNEFTHKPSLARRAAQELAALFRDPDKPPVFLLGAGASFRAGIPMAADAVWWIVNRHFSRYVRGGQLQSPRRSEVEMWLRQEHSQWFNFSPDAIADNFPEAVDRLLVPSEFRREVLHDLVQPRNGINEGYKHLARMMHRGLCRTVLTTNFDRLIQTALKSLEPHVRHVVEVNQVPGDFDQFSLLRKFQVVYLHGSVEHYRDRSTHRETADLDAELARLIEPLLRDWPLIVIGYRGAEPSIMNSLLGRVASSRTAFRNGLYWCTREDTNLHPQVQQLADRVQNNFRHVTIDGFDELLRELDFTLRDVDSFGKGSEVPASEDAPDERPILDARMDDIDLDLAFATLARWASRLERGAVTPENREPLMLELRLAAKVDGKVVPTVGGYLLFGRKPQTRFPQAFVRVLVGHTQRVVDGNLVEQFRALKEILNSPDLNPMLRIKNPDNSDSRLAYPQRVMTETIVNMLVHRDYRIEGFAEIIVTPGRSIRFINPGGLPNEVLARLQPDDKGRFSPVREVTQIRNPCLADIFFGDGSMDRAGSGLADVLVMSRENGGDAEFSIQRNNNEFIAELKQPFQASPGSSTLARPISASGRYITNHLPFRVLPETVYWMPARANPQRSASRSAEGPSLFEEPAPSQRHEGEPVWAGGFKAGRIFSFANLKNFPQFIEDRGIPRLVKEEKTNELEETTEGRRMLSWLLRRHFDHHLQSFASVGLFIDQKRAYFIGSPHDERAITYDSPKKRGIRRVMVKRREMGQRIFHENEGIWYSVERFAAMWCVRLKPTYVFTQEDGCTPLSPFMISRLATRRFRFDRNKNVDDDMTFWIRFLGRGRPVVGIGGLGVDNLILALDYLGFDVPEIEDPDHEHPDKDIA
jgi:SIR2-like domain